jgi:hypothetical protein
MPERVNRSASHALRASILAIAVVALVGGQTSADQPAQLTDTHPCQGILNAYAHAADAALDALQAVAEKLGCDVSGVERVAKPGKGPTNSQADEDTADQADEASDEGADQAAEPNEDATDAGPDVQAKCDRIAQKLAAAQDRPHGKSASAFARQAAHWGCNSN